MEIRAQIEDFLMQKGQTRADNRNTWGGGLRNDADAQTPPLERVTQRVYAFTKPLGESCDLPGVAGPALGHLPSCPLRDWLTHNVFVLLGHVYFWHSPYLWVQSFHVYLKHI